MGWVAVAHRELSYRIAGMHEPGAAVGRTTKPDLLEIGTMKEVLQAAQSLLSLVVVK
jgi:hypothetical protein